MQPIRPATQSNRGLRALSVGALAACLVVAACSGSPGGADSHGSSSDASAPGGAVVRVPGDVATLAEAAAQVEENGMILIAPGVYEEQLLIETPGVTVRGEDRNGTVIDGGGVRPFGVVSIAAGVRVENLTVTGATFYGVLFTGLHDENGPGAPSVTDYELWDPSQFPPLQRFLVDHVTAYNNGLYGIYAFNSQHGVIRDSYASGSADSGFYVGQCEDCDILVTGNVGERSAVGFENANASDSVVVAANRFSGNRIGMTFLSSYLEAFTPQRGNLVAGNLVVDNANPDTPSQADGAYATGIGISGGQGNVLTRNRVSGHERAGLILANTEDIPAAGNVLTENAFLGNSVDVVNLSASRTPATGNCASAPQDPLTSLPAALWEALALGCVDADGAIDPAADPGELLGPSAPPGLSFLKVAPPPDQPNLPQRAEYPRLPDQVTMPDPADIAVPELDFLADRVSFLVS